MKRIFTLLCLVALASMSLLLLRGIDELRDQTRGLTTLIEGLQKQQQALASTVATLKNIPRPTSSVGDPIPEPSRNPTMDVTGASARAVKRIASRSQCARVCQTLVQCLSTSQICPGLGTDGTRDAVQYCTNVCNQDKPSRMKLMDMTDCPARINPDVPASLRDICIDPK